MMLISPKGHKIHCALHFGFLVSNNEAEYEVLIMRLKLAKKLQVDNLKVYSDSQLVMKKVNENYQVRGEKMVTYLVKVKKLMRSISVVTIEVVPRSQNANTDALAKLASIKDAKLLNVVSVEFLAQPSIKQRLEMMEVEQESPWMDPIITSLKHGELPKTRPKLGF